MNSLAEIIIPFPLMNQLIFKTYQIIIIVFFQLLIVYSCSNGTANKNAVIDDGLKYNELSSRAFSHCKKLNFDTTFYFVVDMSIHSGKNRFMVWDFSKQKVTQKALVTHGCGSNGWSSDASSTSPQFSNVCESHCSSLGKYKVSDRGYSQWGMHVKYLLHGLDSSNSNALKRTIVLHSWDAVPDKEIFPVGAPESWGCPAVSNEFMIKLDSMLQSSGKPVLLWMVY